LTKAKTIVDEVQRAREKRGHYLSHCRHNCNFVYRGSTSTAWQQKKSPVMRRLAWQGVSVTGIVWQLDIGDIAFAP